MKDIKELTLENLVSSAVTAKEAIEELEAKLEIVKDELKDRLVAQKITGTKVGNYFVSRVKRLSTSGVEIGQAREVGAIKEAIDSEKIKQLILKGVKIRGVKWTEFLNIREGKNE